MLLRFDDDALKFLEDREMLVSRVNLGVTLLLASQETDLLETLQFALNIARIFFDKLGKTTNVGMKIRILGVDHYDFAPHPRSDKYV